MADSGKLQKKLTTLKQALGSLTKALEVQCEHFSKIETDLIHGGQIQKFEYSLELFWKTAKTFLYETHGIEAMSPKMTIKELYNIKLLDEGEYQGSLSMINDRNRLSPIYNEESFQEIHCQLPNHLHLLRKVTERLDS